MAKKYYPIDEEAAKRAQVMWSFRDYVTGTKTKEYQNLVDEAYQLADDVAEKYPDRAESAYILADKYAKKLADNFFADSHINLRCPSMLIAGPANFPVRKKEQQVRALEKNNQEYNDIQKYLDRIRKLGSNDDIIRSSDTNDVTLLQEKLDTLKQEQEKMKKVNAYYRKHKTLDGCPVLTDEEIEKLKVEMKSSWHYQDKPYLSWQLSNNNQNIHSVEERLQRLKAEKEKDSSEYDSDYFKVVENTEIMRLQLFFDGKPEAEVRELVKHNGFKWSPKNGCWQRQLTNNARYSVKCLIKELSKLAG